MIRWSPMPEPLLSVQDVGVTYERRGLLGRLRAESPSWAVDGATLEVAGGEAVAIVGESGSGKSTIARAIVGLVPVDRGRVVLAGAVASTRRTREQRRLVQLIFQDPYSSLNPRMTVGDAISEAIRVNRMREGSAVAQRTRELLALVQLPSRFIDVHPRHMSGGQRQRASIARALATEPRLLVADEPVSALDVSVQAAILNLFADLRADLGLTLLVISHNLAVVRHVSERIIVMHRGRIVEAGETEAVVEHPRHDYTRTLIASVPSLMPRAPHPTSPATAPGGKA
jgi:ABC-type glutathione transport system ATPase component